MSYEQLRTAQNTPITSHNDLKPGSTVYVTKETVASSSSSASGSSSSAASKSKSEALSAAASASGEALQPATLNKVIDQSVYTVVFNDGDEKTLKRSFIRFKVTRIFRFKPQY